MSQSDVLKIIKSTNKKEIDIDKIVKKLTKKNSNVKRHNVLVWVNKLEKWGYLEKVYQNGKLKKIIIKC